MENYSKLSMKDINYVRLAMEKEEQIRKNVVNVKDKEWW